MSLRSAYASGIEIDGLRCSECHEPLDGFVMVTDAQVEELPERVPGVLAAGLTTMVVDYLTVPCAHHRPPYQTFDGEPIEDALLHG